MCRPDFVQLKPTNALPLAMINRNTIQRVAPITETISIIQFVDGSTAHFEHTPEEIVRMVGWKARQPASVRLRKKK
jgi:hypothetical protein